MHVIRTIKVLLLCGLLMSPILGQALSHHATLAQSYLSQGKLRLAEKELLKAKNRGEPFEEWGVQLGQTYLLQKKYQKALQAATLSDKPPKKLSSTVKIALSLIEARAFIGLKQYNEAEQLLKKSLTLAPKNFEILYFNAEVQLHKHKLGAASHYIQQAIQLPNLSKTDLAKLHILQACKYKHEGQVHTALNSYKQALVADANCHVARVGIANLMLAEREKDIYSEESESIYMSAIHNVE